MATLIFIKNNNTLYFGNNPAGGADESLSIEEVISSQVRMGNLRSIHVYGEHNSIRNMSSAQ